MSDQTALVAPVTTVTEEAPGVTSSKRVAGLGLAGLGGLLLGGLGVFSLFAKAADPTTALACGSTLCTIGAGILVGTVLEGIGKKIGGQA